MDIADFEGKRKIQFFTISSFFAVVLLIVLMAINIINRSFSDVMIDLVLIIILVICYIALRTLKMDLLIYRAGLAALSISFLYSVTTGDSGGRILHSLFVIPLMLFFFLNKKEGAIWCMASYGILCLLLLQPFPTGTYEYEKAEAIHLLLTLLFIIFIAYQPESSRSNYSNRLIEEHTRLKK